MVKAYRVIGDVRSSQIEHPSYLVKRCYNRTGTPYLYKLVSQTPQLGRDGFPSVLIGKMEYGLRRSKGTGGGTQRESIKLGVGMSLEGDALGAGDDEGREECSKSASE